MEWHLRRRFWIEAGLALFSAALLLLTLLWGDWIEAVFHVNPDYGSGSLEKLVLGLTIVAAITFSVLARIEYGRLAALRAHASQ